MIAGKKRTARAKHGPCGAIVSADGTGSAQSKESALRDAGVHIAEGTTHIVDIVAELLK